MPEYPPERRRAIGRSVAALLVGAVAALLTVGVVLAPEDEPRSNTDVRQEFIDRWEAWRRLPVSYVEETTRRSGDDSTTERVDVAQRFPDQIVHNGRQVSARLDSRLVGCGPDDAGVVTCLDNGGYRPDDELEIELDRFRDETAGAQPTYRLSSLGSGCYRLRLLVEEFRPRWGDRLDVCFDERGVVRREVRMHDGVRIVVVRKQIRLDPLDDALDLPADVVEPSDGPVRTMGTVPG